MTQTTVVSVVLSLEFTTILGHVKLVKTAADKIKGDNSCICRSIQPTAPSTI